MTFEGDSYEEIQRALLGALVSAPESAPRGQKVRELLGVQVRLARPRARLTTSPARAAKYTFAAGEFLWYLRGARDVASVAYYNARMRDYSDDGLTLHSAYGYRLGLDDVSPSYWNNVALELKRDSDSRRAVAGIYRNIDLVRALDADGTKDVPCTLSLQFLIRGGRLHLHVTMRSNDAVWGLCNDLFSFTLLQEVMALDLGLELGEYVHTVGSMHVYERHFDLAAAVATESPEAHVEMAPLTSREELARLLVAERELREAGATLYNPPAWSGEAWLFSQLVERRAQVKP